MAADPEQRLSGIDVLDESGMPSSTRGVTGRCWRAGRESASIPELFAAQVARRRGGGDQRRRVAWTYREL